MNFPMALMVANHVVCEKCGKKTPHKPFIGSVQSRLLFVCQECGYHVFHDDVILNMTPREMGHVIWKDIIAEREQ